MQSVMMAAADSSWNVYFVLVAYLFCKGRNGSDCLAEVAAVHCSYCLNIIAIVLDVLLSQIILCSKQARPRGLAHGLIPSYLRVTIGNLTSGPQHH